MNANELADHIESSRGPIGIMTLIEAAAHLRSLHADNELLRKEVSLYLGALARCRDECGFSVDDIHESISMGDPLAVPDFVIEQVNALRKDAARLNFFITCGIEQMQHGNVTKANLLAYALNNEGGEYTIDKFKAAIDAAMEQSK